MCKEYGQEKKAFNTRFVPERHLILWIIWGPRLTSILYLSRSEDHVWQQSAEFRQDLLWKWTDTVSMKQSGRCGKQLRQLKYQVRFCPFNSLFWGLTLHKIQLFWANLLNSPTLLWNKSTQNGFSSENFWKQWPFSNLLLVYIKVGQDWVME